MSFQSQIRFNSPEICHIQQNEYEILSYASSIFFQRMKGEICVPCFNPRDK